MNFPTLVVQMKGSTTSEPIHFGGSSVAAVQPGPNWNGKSITFLATMDEKTYHPVYDALDAQIIIKVDATKYTIVDKEIARGLDWVKIVSSSAESDSITILVRG